MWKTLTILTILLAGAGAFFRFSNSSAAKLETDLLARSEANLEALENHLDTITTQVEEYEAKATATAGEAEQEAGKLETARSEVSQKKAAKKSVEGQIAAKTAQIEALRAKLAKFGEIGDLAAKADGLQVEMTTVQQELLTSKEKFKAIGGRQNAEKKRIAALRDKDEMVKAGKMPAFSTRISQDFTQWNFVVIAAGANQGVNSRATFDVVRGGETIGKLRVTNLESNVAVCDVLSVNDGQSLSAGDRVVVAEESRWDPSKATATAATSATPAAGGTSATDPFGLDPTPGAAPAPEAPAPAGDDPFGLGADTPAGDPAPEAVPDAGGDEADPFGLN